MANRRTFSKPYSDRRYSLNLTLEEVAADIESNRTTLAWRLFVRYNSDGSPGVYDGWNSRRYELTIGGRALASGTWNFDFNHEAEKTIAEGQAVYTHADDGRLTLSFSSRVDLGTKGWGDLSGTYPVSEIPRGLVYFGDSRGKVQRGRVWIADSRGRPQRARAVFIADAHGKPQRSR